MVTDVGVSVQVAPAATVHVKVSVWLNPFSGATETLKFAVPPLAGTVMFAGLGVSVKSGEPFDPGETPVPVRVEDCGEFSA